MYRRINVKYWVLYSKFVHVFMTSGWICSRAAVFKTKSIKYNIGLKTVLVAICDCFSGTRGLSCKTLREYGKRTFLLQYLGKMLEDILTISSNMMLILKSLTGLNVNLKDLTRLMTRLRDQTRLMVKLQGPKTSIIMLQYQTKFMPVLEVQIRWMTVLPDLIRWMVILQDIKRQSFIVKGRTRWMIIMHVQTRWMVKLKDLTWPIV